MSSLNDMQLTFSTCFSIGAFWSLDHIDLIADKYKVVIHALRSEPMVKYVVNSLLVVKVSSTIDFHLLLDSQISGNMMIM